MVDEDKELVLECAWKSDGAKRQLHIYAGTFQRGSRRAARPAACEKLAASGSGCQDEGVAHSGR